MLRFLIMSYASVHLSCVHLKDWPWYTSLVYLKDAMSEMLT